MNFKSSNLSSNDKLYVYVGGKGQDGANEASRTAVGGYNGGGYLQEGQNVFGASGGGATHIATKSGVLSSLANYKSNVLIVSGGGGGANYRNEGYGEGNGGCGGGITGCNGVTTNYSNGYGYGYGSGGTQSAAGTLVWYNGTGPIGSVSSSGFGYAAATSSVMGTGAQSGGGGGYYGGGASGHGGAGGGSGYIGNTSLTSKAMYCYNCPTSTATSTYTVSTTNVSSSPTAKYAKSGDGYARITFVSSS